MALSGSISNAFRTGYRIQIDWTATQNVANNTSTITAKFYLISTGSGYNISSSASKSCKTKIDGVDYSNSVTIGLAGNQTKLLATNTRTISHNADGTKTFKLGGSLELAVTLSGTYWGTVNIAEQTFTLDTIPRATTPTLSSGSVTIGNAVTINTPRASSAFTHRLFYKWSGGSWISIATGVATSYSWTTPMSLCSGLPNSTSGKITIAVDTYNGSTFIGTKTIDLTLNVPSSVVPTVSISKSGVDLYSSKYVQGRSKVAVTLSASGSYGSSIKTRSTTVKSGNNTITSSSANSFTSGVLTYSGTITIATTVTDSRGRTASSSTTISVVAYSVPRITAFSAFRANSDGSANPQGAYIRITGSASISPIDSTNTKSTILRYRLKGATTWTNATTNMASYTPSLAVTIPADVNSSFEVQIYTADYFSSTSQTVNVGTAFVLMDFRSTGKGVAFGKVSEKDAFEVGIPAEFNETALFNGGGRMPGGYFAPMWSALNGTALTVDGKDMNDIKETGLYRGYNMTNHALSPTTTISSFVVIKYSNDWITQIQMTIEGNPRMYMRTYTGGNTWSEWKRMFVTGDSYITLSGAPMYYGIQETGSNSNGRFIKFGDGTLICWHIPTISSYTVDAAWGTWFVGAQQTWTFPHAFVGEAIVTAGGSPSSGNVLVLVISTSTVSATHYAVRPTSAATITYRPSLMAIGRWR